MAMKRYWLFAGQDYYPGGGMWDFVGDFETLQAAKDAWKEGNWAHIFDQERTLVLWWYVPPGKSQRQGWDSGWAFIYEGPPWMWSVGRKAVPVQ